MNMSDKQSLEVQQHNILPDPSSLDTLPDDADVPLKDLWLTKPSVINFETVDPGTNAGWE